MDLKMGKIWPTLNFSECRAKTVPWGDRGVISSGVISKGFGQCVAHGRLQVPQQEHCNVAGCINW